MNLNHESFESSFFFFKIPEFLKKRRKYRQGVRQNLNPTNEDKPVLGKQVTD